MPKVSLEVRDPWRAHVQLCQAAITDSTTRIQLLHGELYQVQERIQAEILKAETNRSLAKESAGMIIELLRKEAGAEDGQYILSSDGATIIGEVADKADKP